MLSKNAPRAVHEADAKAAMARTLDLYDKLAGVTGQHGRVAIASVLQQRARKAQGFATLPIGSNAFLNDIKSDELNLMMLGVFYDIYNAYLRLQRSRNTRLARKAVDNGKLNEVKNLYGELKSLVKQLEYQVSYPTHDRVDVQDFRSAANNYRGVSAAEIDNEAGRLRLPYLTKRSVTDGAIVSVTDVSGGTIVQDSSHGLQYIIDPDPNTYWSRSYISPTPLGAIDVDIGDGQTYEEVVGRKIAGAVVNLDITLQKTMPITEIRLLPFCRWPLLILDVSRREADSDDFKQIPVFDTVQASPNKDYLTFNFPKAWAKTIRLTLAQESYEEIFHSVARGQTVVRSMASQIDQTESILADALTRMQDILSRTSLNRPEELISKVMQAVGAAVEQLDHQAGNEIISMAGGQPVEDSEEIRGYMYNIGLADVQILTGDRLPQGVYRSPAIANDIDVFRIQIETHEDHPVLYDTRNVPHRQTDIWWFADLGQGRSIPILPTNSVDEEGDPWVVAERLDVRGGSAVTRWPIDTSKTFEVRGNGKRISQIIISGQRVIINDYNPNIVYCITYYPTSDPTDILLEDHVRSVRMPDEYFAKSVDRSITLPAWPFICRQIVNDYQHFNRPDPYNGLWLYTGEAGEVLATDGISPLHATEAEVEAGLYSLLEIDGFNWGSVDGYEKSYEPIIVTVGGERALNVTDYVGNENRLRPGGAGYRYIQRGRTITFNQQASNIRVSYNSLAPNLRIVASLNSNRTAHDVSPAVRELAVMTSGRSV